MNSCIYRLLQLTNSSVGTVALSTAMPLGNVSRRISANESARPTFEVTTSGSDAVVITETGYYKITYNASLAVAAAGNIIINLQLNDSIVQTISYTASAAGTYNLSSIFMTRVLANCANVINNPVAVQLINASTSTEITGGTSTLIIERMAK